MQSARSMLLSGTFSPTTSDDREVLYTVPDNAYAEVVVQHFTGTGRSHREWEVRLSVGYAFWRKSNGQEPSRHLNEPEGRQLEDHDFGKKILLVAGEDIEVGGVVYLSDSSVVHYYIQIVEHQR